ncbi:MAG: lactate/malate family dehydrogenase, partial [Bacilli bacterium]
MNRINLRKVALVGTGFVGMSFAYALINQSIVDVLYLIDRDDEKASSEAMDLNHGSNFAPSYTKVVAGGYECCKEVDIVVLCAGAAQLPNETRLDLASRNTIIIKD